MDRPRDLKLLLPADPAVPAVAVESLAWGALRAAYPLEVAPLLLIGQAVALGLTGAGLDGLVRARGVVTGRVDQPDRRVYDVQLDHADGTALDAAVNRRAAVRVTPDPGAPVLVRLRTDSDAQVVQALLRDLSVGGLSVLIGHEQEWLLAPSTSLWIELRLPGCAEELSLRGRVVHRRLERTAIHYGIELQIAGSAAAGPLEAIRAFVAARSAGRRPASQSDAA